MKKPNPLVPQFVTMLFTLVSVQQAGKGFIPIPTCCEDHIPSGHRAMRLKFFAFLGFQMFKKVELLVPEDQEVNDEA